MYSKCPIQWVGRVLKIASSVGREVGGGGGGGVTQNSIFSGERGGSF